MRVSTSQIFDSGYRGIGGNQFDLFKLQNHLSTGRRMLAPEDDPVAAAQALVVTQSQSVNGQYLANQADAKGRLGVLDGQLQSLNNLLQHVRERVVQAGNTTLTGADRSYIADELESRFAELLGLANAQDATGNYLFSGYQGTLKPFAQTTTGANYQGDDGVRLLQVEASRDMPTNISGIELFTQIKNGNATFQTGASGNVLPVPVPPAVGAVNTPPNLGTAIIDQGSVRDVTAWNAALAATTALAIPATTPQQYRDLELRFSINNTVTPPVTEYNVFAIDKVANTSAQLNAAPLPYTPGQAINLSGLTTTPADLGISVSVSGNPADGDSFRITPSVNQDVFTTLRNTINTIRTGVAPELNAAGSVIGGISSIEYSNRLAGNLQNISNALENVNRMQSTVGARLHELDALSNTGEDKKLQYATSLSALQDLDYTKAISDLTRKQMQLEAAQISFKQTSQLTLFNIL